MTIKNRGGVFGRNPTFNDVDVDGTLSVGGAAIPAPANTAKLDTAQTFTATQNFSAVGVGTSSPSTPIHINTSAALGASFTGTTDGEGVSITVPYVADNYVSLIEAPYTTGGTPNVRIAAKFTGGGAELSFGTSNSYGNGITNEALTIDPSGNLDLSNGTGNLKFASGNGIDFSATAGTGTSELFDDYEEGTWTPVVAGLTTAGTYELQKAVAKYTKVGDLVTIEAFIQLAAAVTGGGAGSLGITGVPFSKPADAYPAAAAYVAGVTISETPIVVFSSFSASSTLILQQNASGGFGTSVAITDVGVSDYISFSMTYKVA